MLNKKELTPLDATYEFYQRCREIQKSGKYEINISSNYSGDGIIDILEKKPIRLMERICFESRKDIEKLDELVDRALNKYLEKENEAIKFVKVLEKNISRGFSLEIFS